MWKKLKKVFKRGKPSPYFPPWKDVKSTRFYHSRLTFEENIAKIDGYIQRGGVDIPTTVLECGHYHEMFPTSSKRRVENLICDSEAALDILRGYVHLLPDHTPIGGKWLEEKVSKGKFTRMWKFVISPTVKEIRSIYGVKPEVS